MAEPSTVKLPELPEPECGVWDHERTNWTAYTPDQMTAYGMACRLQALEEAARQCDLHDAANTGHVGASIAAAIRSLAGEGKGT